MGNVGVLYEGTRKVNPVNRCPFTLWINPLWLLGYIYPLLPLTVFHFSLHFNVTLVRPIAIRSNHAKVIRQRPLRVLVSLDLLILWELTVHIVEIVVIDFHILNIFYCVLEAPTRSGGACLQLRGCVLDHVPRPVAHLRFHNIRAVH